MAGPGSRLRCAPRRRLTAKPDVPNSAQPGRSCPGRQDLLRHAYAQPPEGQVHSQAPLLPRLGASSLGTNGNRLSETQPGREGGLLALRARFRYVWTVSPEAGRMAVCDLMTARRLLWRT